MATQRLGIDPDLTGSGVALAVGGRLVRVGVLRVPKAVRALHERICWQRELLRAWAVGYTHITVELPRVYPGVRANDPNDLIDLAALAGALLACGTTGDLVWPGTWKGQVPKDVHHARLAKAHPEAAAMIDVLPKGARSEAWDAVGILYYGMERTEQR